MSSFRQNLLSTFALKRPMSCPTSFSLRLVMARLGQNLPPRMSTSLAVW
ncbi:unnamed protein product [Dibothriocephalus latus]|uniref:Uncharacterized protein n=1 Tax=Dibothriocephalus latus TaxID=60516 RepID=A0A3P6QLI5_DIBLA|nr:unnamed protein product [Dibothriocephalus latus]